MRRRPSRRSVKQFALFNIGGAVFFITGYSIFAVLYGVFGWKWWLAKMLADLIGWATNYLIQRFLVFRHESKAHKESTLIAKFSTISVANVPIDYAIVGGLKFIGISPFIGLFVSAAFFTVWKFIWYKFWVFKDHRTHVA